LSLSERWRLARLVRTETKGGPLGDRIDVVDRMLCQVRDVSLDLWPSLLDDLGLVPAVEWSMDR